MKRVCLLSSVVALLFLTLTAQSPAQAQERGYWRAASNTARSITGDVTLGSEKLTINFFSTPISHIRDLQPTEISAVFDTDANSPGSGSLYRLTIPGSKKFLHKNSLCGDEDVQWMVSYAASGSLQLAFFSADKPPVLTFDAVSKSTDLCGTYTYVK